jgi:hypothetical protein
MDKKTEKLLKLRNVVMVGEGHKVVGGVDTRKPCIVVGVVKKLPLSALAASDIVPKTVSGKDTDVIQVGEIRLLQARTDKWRPSLPGVSIGHKDITAGTFGLVVKRNGVRHILSNNHVLANVNNGQVGDAIMQPGPYDITAEMGNCEIGKLADFVPISVVGVSDCPLAKTVVKGLNFLAKLFKRKTRIPPPVVQQEINLVDCAIALPNNDADIEERILEVGLVSGIKEAEVGIQVKKSGRTTGLSFGDVTAINAVVTVNMGGMDFALFEDQIVTGYMSAGGDSGSALLDLENNVVGLLFAGSDQSTVFNRIQNVLEALGVEI